MLWKVQNNLMESFTPQTESILLNHGWIPNQRHDVSIARKFWEEQNYNWFESTESFLSEFWNVDVESVEINGKHHELFLYFKRGGFFDHTFVSEISDVFSLVDSEYKNLLSPISQIYEMNIPLFIDRYSNFYLGSMFCYTPGIFQCEILKIAENKSDFFEYLFSDEHLKYIHMRYRKHFLREETKKLVNLKKLKHQNIFSTLLALFRNILGNKF
jgi:hypothetical protein